MLALIFLLVVFFVVVCLPGLIVYGPDWVDNIKRNKQRSNSISKLAELKLVSNDSKDIESFATKNVDSLSDKMFNRLVVRIEDLRVDDDLKMRYDELSENDEEILLNNEGKS